MGNQMFQYAFARALAERNHDFVVLDAAPLLDRTPRPNFVFRGYDLDIFNIDARLTLFSRAALRFPMPVLWAGLSVVAIFIKSVFGAQKFIRENSSFIVNSEIDLGAIPCDGNIYLDGAWQSEKYFASIAPTIRRGFTLREPLSVHAQKLETEIRSGESICVNVRRGDFITVERSAKEHGFVGLEYYQKGIEVITSRVKNPRIYVFSDEIEWCRQNVKFPARPNMPVMYVGNEYDGKKFGEYLHLMSACKHFVIANSSFAWWGAWLASNPDKIIVAPRQWFASGAPERGVVPEGWLRV